MMVFKIIQYYRRYLDILKRRSVNISSLYNPTVENCLFDKVKLTKHNNDVDLQKYSGYGIGFDKKGSYSIGDEVGRKIIIFGVDMSSSSRTDNKKKDILILGKGATQEIDRTCTGCRKIVFNQL